MASAGGQGAFAFTGSSGRSGSDPFDSLRDALAMDHALHDEMESALRLNVDRVNPSDQGNRFVVGGAVEWIVAAAAWAAGALSLPAGHSQKGFDLMALQGAARGMWSVKSQSAAKSAAFRITNGLGGAGRGFAEPTIFVSPNLPGLVLIDPDQHVDTTARAQQKSDAVVLPFGAVLDHARIHPECVAPLRAPANEGRGRENPFLAYSETILTPDRFPRLSKMFSASRPSAGTVTDEVMRLLALRDSGAITAVQFDELIKSVTAA
jgi:hypothetical protein